VEKAWAAVEVLAGLALSPTGSSVRTGLGRLSAPTMDFLSEFLFFAEN
jgi:hypothetical protein